MFLIPRTRPQRVAVALAVVAGTMTIAWFAFAAVEQPARDASPPRASGYFPTLPPGSWSRLPSGADCSKRVHRSTWEPRPDNWVPNHAVPIEREIRRSFATRSQWIHSRWDSRLLPRVTGRHTGTTDENIQWAACKWGISDSLLRAVAVRESNWFQYEVYPNGTCVDTFGCADLLRTPDPAARRYCAGISQAGRDYERDFGRGRCPKTFSIVGVESWQDPAWGQSPEYQNGTFPFSRDSTAFALDYFASYLRGCDEGWIDWLKNSGDGRYGPGDVWGCVGSWEAGAWYTKPALDYIADVRHELRNHTWLDPAWGEFRPPCTSRGCPHGL